MCMKKLSKLHLRSEQYLTDSEMKLISGGADENIYYDCGLYDQDHGRCMTMMQCSKNVYSTYPPETGTYSIKFGVCMHGYDFSTGKVGCYCDIKP